MPTVNFYLVDLVEILCWKEDVFFDFIQSSNTGEKIT